MKTAIVIQDGLFQVVLTPESDIERMALDKLKDTQNLETFQGSYYECQGGWVRQGSGDNSTIFVHHPKART